MYPCSVLPHALLLQAIRANLSQEKPQALLHAVGVDSNRCAYALPCCVPCCLLTLLQAIRANLGQEELQALLQETEAVLDDDAQVGGDSTVMRVWKFGERCGEIQQDCDVKSAAQLSNFQAFPCCDISSSSCLLWPAKQGWCEHKASLPLLSLYSCCCCCCCCVSCLQASKTQFVNKVQQCFAVRAQVDSLLDISRATFTRLTEAIHELTAKYRCGTHHLS
jgi:hypothetical protein